MGVTVTFPTRAGTGQGYLAVPANSADPAPAVVVIHEWWSSDPQIRGVADRFAAEGFVALVPDLYHGVTAGRPDPATDLLMGLAMDTAADDIAAAAGYLAARPDGTAHIGTAGFGLGGSLALWSASRADQITAAVAWYPELPWERMPTKWDGYRDTAALLHLPEQSDPDPGTVSALTDAVATAGGHLTAHHYPTTGTAFFNDDRPDSYDNDAATLSWARTLEHLRHHLIPQHQAAA
jgi:carboxymethylenebutenolidase